MGRVRKKQAINLEEDINIQADLYLKIFGIRVKLKNILDMDYHIEGKDGESLEILEIEAALNMAD